MSHIPDIRTTHSALSQNLISETQTLLAVHRQADSLYVATDARNNVEYVVNSLYRNDALIRWFNEVIISSKPSVELRVSPGLAHKTKFSDFGANLVGLTRVGFQGGQASKRLIHASSELFANSCGEIWPPSQQK